MAAGPGATVKAYVFEHTRDDGSVEFRIYPPLVVLAPGDTLEFENLTEVEWDWDCPSQAAKGKVPKAKKTPVFTVPPGTPKQAAPCTMTGPGGRKAKGLSDPMIIIDG